MQETRLRVLEVATAPFRWGSGPMFRLLAIVCYLRRWGHPSAVACLPRTPPSLPIDGRGTGGRGRDRVGEGGEKAVNGGD